MFWWDSWDREVVIVEMFDDHGWIHVVEKSMGVYVSY